MVRSGLVHEPGEAAVYGDLDFIVLGAVVDGKVKVVAGVANSVYNDYQEGKLIQAITDRVMAEIAKR